MSLYLCDDMTCIHAGVIDLLSDESTESNNVINIVQRFNIFQEIFLAAVYRGFSLNVCINYLATLAIDPLAAMT